jgi:hypothetical protein
MSRKSVQCSPPFTSEQRQGEASKPNLVDSLLMRLNAIWRIEDNVQGRIQKSECPLQLVDNFIYSKRID